MRFHNCFRVRFALFLCFVLPLSISAADKKKAKAAAAEADQPSYELLQPAKENLDYTMYQRIREEGLTHSHVMDFASALMDGIGPRLTGSPNLRRANEWTRDQLAAMGPFGEQLGRTVSGFNPTATNTASGTQLAGAESVTGGVSTFTVSSVNSLGGLTFPNANYGAPYQTNSGFFSPRIGFSYSPAMFSNKTVLDRKS